MQQQSSIPVKVVLVGDSMVGKTSILRSYVLNEFLQKQVHSPLDSSTLSVKINDQLVSLGIWDLGGEADSYLSHLAYTNCDIFVIVFSISDRSSYDNAIQKWYTDIISHIREPIIIFAGNKVDLRNEQERLVPCEWARKTIDANTGCRYMECSAQTQEGIAELFKLAIDIVLKGLKSKQNAKSKSTQKQNGTADCACVLM